MTERFDGRVAVITGGASGIGLAIARRLVSEGARVVLGDLNEAGLDAAINELGGADQAIGSRCDVQVESDVESLVATAGERFGRLDIGVNCAGLATLSPVADHPKDGWDLTLGVCLTGVFLAVKHEAAVMRAAGSGVIIHIASINGIVPAKGMVAYCTAKAGVVMLTRVAAMELGEAGVRVVGIGPGLVDTPLTSFQRDVPAIRDAYLRSIPMGRSGTPEDVANLATWLASDEASWVSGHTFYTDGAEANLGYPDFFDILSQPPA